MALAVVCLLRHIADPECAPDTAPVEPKLMVRASTRPAGANGGGASRTSSDTSAVSARA
ncbi:hypothetical protein ACFXGT_28720 [Streptomyces sp. NPDC059352]|uniref:hypothetical protein n=1 Tax=Streptomyces sp. NPDC059352 TaxID=3346810 RepID=UPI0036CE8AA9